MNLPSSSTTVGFGTPELRSEGGAWTAALTVAVLTVPVQVVSCGVLLLALLILNCRGSTCAARVNSDVVIQVSLCALLLMGLALPARLTQSWAARRSVDAVGGDRRATATRRVVFFALVVSPLAMVAFSGLLFSFG